MNGVGEDEVTVTSGLHALPVRTLGQGEPACARKPRSAASSRPQRRHLRPHPNWETHPPNTQEKTAMRHTRGSETEVIRDVPQRNDGFHMTSSCFQLLLG